MPSASRSSKDPLETAVSTKLWPELRNSGFHKVAPRLFARTRGELLDRVMVDARGINGRASTHVIVTSDLLSSPRIAGYILGGRLQDGPWDMSEEPIANSNMSSVVAILHSTSVPWLNRIDGAAGLLSVYESMDYRPPEPLLFQRALAKAVLGDSEGACGDLTSVLDGSFDHWKRPESPARILLDSIQAGVSDVLLANWTAKNRATFKVPVASA